MNNKNKPLSRRHELLTQEIADEFLIYDLLANKAYNLNQTSASIWQLCDGTRTLKDLAAAAGQKMNAEVSEDLVSLALDQFKQDELLEDNEIEIPGLAGMSRRQLIRKVGLASVVALPLITSLVVPAAAAAQSCLANGTICNSAAASQCCSNRCNYNVGAGGFRCI